MWWLLLELKYHIENGYFKRKALRFRIAIGLEVSSKRILQKYKTHKQNHIPLIFTNYSLTIVAMKHSIGVGNSLHKINLRDSEANPRNGKCSTTIKRARLDIKPIVYQTSSG